MAPPISPNVFLRLPSATAALLLSAVFDLTNGHALPRQTKVVAFRELDVIPFPPAPTGQPLFPFGLEPRQENTICGYLGGNSDLPATCSLGSHCVLDPANSVVGCCPNGGVCTTGVFTGCVDRNSDPQTEINPYVYTCQGGDVCFMNNFAGGYFQYGCGTASELGTTVKTSADGATAALSISTVDVSLTESPSHLSKPTTIGSSVSTKTTSSRSSTTSTTTTSSSTHKSSTSTTHSSSTSTSPAATGTEAPGSTKQNHTGAIIGGVVGGAAAAILLVALIIYCLRRRNRNRREGPGPAPTPAPTTQYGPRGPSHGAAFAPLPSWQDDESSSAPGIHNNPPPPPEPYGPLERNRAGSTNFYNPPNSHPPDSYGPIEPGLSAPAPANMMGTPVHGFSQPQRYNPAYMTAGLQQPKGSLTPVVEEDHSLEREREEPHAREIDDFSRAYSSAGIGQLSDRGVEEDRAPLRDNSQEAREREGSASPPRGGSGHRPLWQQNRQQSRNLMWL